MTNFNEGLAEARQEIREALMENIGPLVPVPRTAIEVLLERLKHPPYEYAPIDPFGDNQRRQQRIEMLKLVPSSVLDRISQIAAQQDPMNPSATFGKFLREIADGMYEELSK